MITSNDVTVKEEQLTGEEFTGDKQLKKRSMRYDHVDMEELVETASNSSSSSNSKKLKFEPALYLQRYDYLCTTLQRLSCRSWLDVGCSDCRLVGRVKNFNESMNLIVGLDIDQALLESSREKFTQQWYDFFQARQNPLDLYLIAGDVANVDPYFLDQVREKLNYY